MSDSMTEQMCSIVLFMFDGNKRNTNQMGAPVL